MLKKQILVVLLMFVFELVHAQKTFKYFLNDREISGYSFCYFEPSDFDSIKTYGGAEIERRLKFKTAGVDSVCIVYKNDISGFAFYNDLCNKYHLSKKGRKQGLGIPGQSSKDLALTIFDKKFITGLHVSMFRHNKFTPKAVMIEMHALYNIAYKRDLVITFERILYGNNLNKL